MMRSQINPKQSWLRAVLAAAFALAGAAAFGAILASALAIRDPHGRASLQNPFDSSRSLK